MYVAVQSVAMTTMTVTAARAALPEIVDRVLAGEEVTLTRHGRPVAVIIRPDRLRTRRQAVAELYADAGELRKRLAQARREPLRSATIDDRYAEEMIADLRERGEDDPWTRSTATS